MSAENLPIDTTIATAVYQREVLANAIQEAAQASNVVENVQLSGPQLLLAAKDMGQIILEQEAALSHIRKELARTKELLEAGEGAQAIRTVWALIQKETQCV